MRTFLLALMITMLPLRGWVGDGMAMQPLAQTSAASGDCHESLAPHDPALAHAPGAAHETAEASEHCGGCTSCQLCHTVALAVLPSAVALAAPRAAAPQTQARLHASAAPAPGYKPPIA